jgi:uncharacterized protein (TIGR03437 family)
MSILRAGSYQKQNRQFFPSLLHSLLFLIFSAFLLAGGASVCHAATLTVPAGGDLQKAINAAQPGDTIVLAAGASFIGPFTLPNKGASTEWITIRTSTIDSALPSATARISPADAPLLPKLLSAGLTESALQTAPGAHHYRLIGIEIRTVNADALVYDLVKLGDGSSAQNTLEKVPHHLILDRCLITAFATQTLKRGVSLHSAETSIINCYIAGFKSAEQDSQAIGGWNGPGPFHIINNYLEAAGENIMFGGATPSIPGLVPSDIEIKRNYLFKPLSWRKGEASYAGTRWSVKNLFELKSARRVLFEGNVLENCWGDVFQGYGAISLTVRGDSGPQATIEDVVVRYNIMRHTPNGINVLGKDTYDPSAQGRGVRIENNLFVDIDGARWNGDGEFLKVSQMPQLVVNHNTVMHTGNILTAYGEASTGFEFTNNIIKHNAYGMIGVNQGPGNGTLNAFFPSAIVRRNVLVKAEPGDYPSDNFFATSLDQVIFNNASANDYSLAPVSPYKSLATDGKDLGYDPGALATAAVPPSETPSATPTPVPTPVPTPTQTPIPTVTPTPTPMLATPKLVAGALANASALAADVNTSTAQIALLMTQMEQAYATFISEMKYLSSTSSIDTGMRASLYFMRAAYGLCEVDGASPRVQGRLQVAASYLNQVSGLMPTTSSASANDTFTAHATSSIIASPVIGLADTRSSATFAPVISPASLGTILGDPNQSILSTQTAAAAQIIDGKLPYELAGVSVTVGGRAAQVLTVSPSRISFYVPAGLAAGEAEVIVTLQAGYVSRGTVTIAPLAPGIFTKSGNGTGEATALDSNGLSVGPFDVYTYNPLVQDTRSRIIIFTTGISNSSLSNFNKSNDVILSGTTIPNFAESVGVQARTRDGRIFNLAVEYAGAQGLALGLDQVNVILPPELKGAGVVELTLITGNQRSNTATVSIK